MFDTLDVLPLVTCADDVAAQLANVASYSYQENVAARRKIHAARDLWESRLDEAFDSDGDPLLASNAATCEAAVLLGCSRRTAQTMIEVAQVLVFQLLEVDKAFARGEIDYAKVRTVCSILREASAEVVSAIEADVVAAAQHLTPGPLRKEVWRLWMRAAPDEAAAAQAHRRDAERTAYVRGGDDGLSWLTACLTDVEGAEASTLINELADSLCPADPRTRGSRRADALVALLHGETVLACRCGRAECASARSAQQPARRGHLLNVVVGIETLLGLSNDPGHLPDGTPLTPAAVRALAQDATWRGLLTEMRSLVPNTEAPSRALSCRHYVAAGRKRYRPGTLSLGCEARVTPKPVAGVGSQLDDFVDAIAMNPELAHGIDPQGHGGYLAPPEGALTYRPSAATTAVVHAVYPTCVFPGCNVPSRRCQLDHRVAFNHQHPLLGGWTIAANLQPLCPLHHQLKTAREWTCVLLEAGAVLWSSRSGITRVTMPPHGGLAGRPPP
ncbi:HNH endonuclease [Hoyosella sp. YIM 151337]|uniref:HNH endonuclease signature motif containing protein n=1 Tax=Hoyosella sp. YIM 151337 TaxID=2992742 RepID=UPI002235D23F|nr:HNH endonuclease signature motif containing protein [Hoyosella sp. YIM 151337]MCW4354451.1 HNH endonuclease [Hoyosella sp. YIM 151337]